MPRPGIFDLDAIPAPSAAEAEAIFGTRLVLNDHYEDDAEIVFKQACMLGCEGIVSKWLGSPYRFGSHLASGRRSNRATNASNSACRLVSVFWKTLLRTLRAVS